MTGKIDRREALLTAGGLAVAASAPAAARKAATSKAAGQFEALPLPYRSMLPQTQYFEIDSAKANARYGIWITVPKSYDKEPKRSFAAIFSPDANFTAAINAGLPDLNAWDFIDAYQPTIQIGIGYPPEDADRSLAVRARDLLPPKEYLFPGMAEGVRSMSDSGLLSKADANLYADNLENPKGDRFLAFITEELYPFVAKNYRIQPDTVGLYGHSYGGLFATYAALQKTTIFKNICASSPGIASLHSVIFQMYKDAVAGGGIKDRNLHMTVGTRELTDPTIYQTMVGAGTIEFMRTVGTTPLKGLNFSSELFETESHATLGPVAMHAFLRRFYNRKA